MASRQYYYEEPAYVIAGGSILPFFAIVVTALRLRVRVQQRQPLRADDWLVIPAMVPARLTGGLSMLSSLADNEQLQIFAVAIGVLEIYSVSQHALAYPLEVPADYEGDPLLLVTPQIVLSAKVCIRNHRSVPDLTSLCRRKLPFY